MPVARERWEFIVYVGAAVFVFTCKMLVFVMMAEGWLRDSEPIIFFWDQIVFDSQVSCRRKVVL